jgi:fatty-acyl-CoA synthase
MSKPLIKAQLFGPHNTKHNLWYLIAHAAYQFPNRQAVVSCWQDLRWNYAELIESTERLASWLVQNKCKKGDYLIAVLGNCAEWVHCLLAAVRLGMIFVPLNPKNPGISKQIESLPEKSRYVLAFLNEDFATNKINYLQPEEMAKFLFICCSALKGRDSHRFNLEWFWFHEIISSPLENTSPLPIESISDSDYVLVLFTSGTTSGVTKACAYTSTNIWSQTSLRLSSEEEHRTIISIHLFHIFGINQALRTLRYSGRLVLPAENFDVPSILRAIREEQCTHMPAVKPMLEALTQTQTQEAYPSTTLRTIELGADFVSLAEINHYKGKLNVKYIFQSFGTTECGPIAGWSDLDPVADGVGRIFAGVNIKICSSEDPYNILNRNETGMLHVSGPSVISSYFIKPDGQGDRDFYEDEGIWWFIPGDLALMDEKNVVHLRGRYKDLIKRGEMSIVPVEAESWARKKFNIMVSLLTGSIFGWCSKC